MPIGGVATIPSFSDHLAIMCKIPVEPPSDIIYHLKVKNFNKTNIGKLDEFILRGLKQQIIPLKQNLSDGECEQLAHSTNQLFDTTVNKYVPTSSPNVNRTLLSSTTRAPQHESKKLYIILFRNKILLNFERAKFIKTRIKLLHQMIINSVRILGNFLLTFIIPLRTTEMPIE